MAREVTQRQRAEAIVNSIYGPASSRCMGSSWDDYVQEVDQALSTARQEALREVVALHQEWLDGKHSGTFSDVLLDRLTREGVTG